MSAVEQPQTYLITPTSFQLDRFSEQLGRVLDARPVACVRLALAGRDEDAIARAADTLREVAHQRDVALVIADHILMAERLGLDGVHLSDAARSVRAARKELGADAIVGSFCHGSRHDGLSAGEAGADYVAFGPVGHSRLEDGARAEADLFTWWSQVIEVPVVAEGGLDADLITSLAPHTDFFGIGDEIWRAEDPVAALAALQALMG